MSKYEWEHGVIDIPAKEWVSFRTDLIKTWNRMQEERLEKAKVLYARAKEEIKGKRGSERRKALRGFFERCEDRRQFDALNVIRSWDGATPKLSTSAPKKKDFKTLPVTKSCTISFEDATITLDNEARTATWSVSENNHACEVARQHPMGRAFFDRLGLVRWTRDTGGVVVGNDEYSGGEYTTASFGLDTRKSGPAGYSNYGGGGPFSPMGGPRW